MQLHQYQFDNEDYGNHTDNTNQQHSTLKIRFLDNEKDPFRLSTCFDKTCPSNNKDEKGEEIRVSHWMVYLQLK
jgi:hypothetical protein